MISFRSLKTIGAAVIVAIGLTSALHAETIRVAVGTQDTTINCATGGLLIRELKLLERFLPHDGKYKDVTYDIQWKNFTSGAPLTNEMVAGKLDFGAMADFPGSLNGVAFQKAGRRSLFISVLSGSAKGSGNGIVVPLNSPVQSIDDLKGKTISVPFASTSHGMLLRAIEGKGWNPETDVNIITQAPEVAGPALQANKIEAHADFVPFAELFPWRGFARKIFDGSQANTPTFHGALVDADYAEKYPEIVIAYLRAALEADRLIATEPEKYSELIAKVTGIEAEVVYLFHGPLGLQTRDVTWKPEYRQAVATSIKTLKFLKRADSDLDINQFVTDKYIRDASAQSGRDYDAQLKNYDQLALKAKDAATGVEITDFSRTAQIWVKDEPLVRHYGSPENALKALAALEKEGKTVRVVYAQDRETGIKLFANQAWFVRSPKGELSAFLLKDGAERWSKEHGGAVVDYAGARESLVASR
ncbi:MULTISPECIES: ABC transporter substrate-binding protein [Bradyrhizobium]|jgi:sulfonate transport system substrate-binding protein|uniref:ABC transporter substrate-binding protein n=1 Tax=Bradyrhizobium TaxID=374 RepID=UPI0004AD51C7|nr:MULTISPECIES: ABC transporter substrate-binding protein [Bradyrhizobium]MCS3451219.1 NitT/TauT family transport system substrate-binding protein [Bradyrhizobium elkanii]MCS3566758.1 NitT/TauT family transport system substrate-binding protein [Bradyrhizobium elkanii]MCW2152517.1 NitT/TauT family transport system substrate-binding protein [Bradyrhizobium elkanii]MCW2357605.1 NitT/TauT family transport system substrate-binding protein [Bradyrhizobium elkanii]MCW2376248.1 NitT/TauT family trans